MKYIKLSHALKGYPEPDTSTPSQGWVPAGTYAIVEDRSNANLDADYVAVEVPSLGREETWICTRWRTSSYAKFVEQENRAAPILDFSTDDDAVDEHFLTDLLPNFYGFTYDLDQAHYPYDIPGFRTPVAQTDDEKTNNCCTFVEGLVAKAWQNAKDNFRWSQEQHGQMMIFSADDYFSPVSCLVNSGMAEAIEDQDAPPHPWTVIQGWRKQWTSGHTFFILGHDEASDRVLTLESNASYKMNGPGYRMIGGLAEFPQPPEDWRIRADLWTWERMKSVYRFRQQAILKVNNRRFVP